MTTPTWRRWLAVPAVAALALILAACGGPSNGDVEGQVLAMRDASQQPVLQAGTTVVLAGNGVDCGQRADRCVAHTDEQGKYQFRDLPAGNYGIAFSVPAKEGEPALQEEAREFSVSPGKVETVSVVLLAENIARPTVPPAELTQAAQQGQSGGFGSSLTSNPFFWYFVFNQPWLGGYQRPPVVVYAPGQDRPVVADSSQSQPGRPGRSYSSYGPPGAAGTKPAPQAVDSKGVTRPGANAAIPGGGAGTSPALDDSSRGVTRPGQAPSGSTGSAAGSGSSASRTDQSGSPPRVGAGGGSTAGRSPSRGVSPPRVRAGRR